MLPLGLKIQIAWDNAKNGLARLTGHDAPWFNGEEKDLVQYRHRVEKTIAYVRWFTPRDFDGSEVRTIDRALPGAHYAMSGGTMSGTSCCRTSTSTSPSPTPSCATKASRSASGTTWETCRRLRWILACRPTGIEIGRAHV